MIHNPLYKINFSLVNIIHQFMNLMQQISLHLITSINQFYLINIYI